MIAQQVFNELSASWKGGSVYYFSKPGTLRVEFVIDNRREVEPQRKFWEEFKSRFAELSKGQNDYL